MTDALMRNAAVESALGSRATAGDSTFTQNLTETRLTPPRSTTEVGGIRGMARALNNDVDNLHKRTHEDEWRTAAAERGKANVKSMLTELADLGFAWRQIAQSLCESEPREEESRRREGRS